MLHLVWGYLVAARPTSYSAPRDPACVLVCDAEEVRCPDEADEPEEQTESDEAEPSLEVQGHDGSKVGTRVATGRSQGKR